MGKWSEFVPVSCDWAAVNGIFLMGDISASEE
jgi:hypothetical protein